MWCFCRKMGTIPFVHILQTCMYVSSCWRTFLSRLTCAYLACKVDEFNVSSTQFVGNLLHETPAGQERVLQQILEYELLLIQQLSFHLVVHNPYRPLEGLLIDLKVCTLQKRAECHSRSPVFNPCSLSFRLAILHWRTQSHWGRVLMTFWPRRSWRMPDCCVLPLRSLWQLFWIAL